MSQISISKDDLLELLNEKIDDSCHILIDFETDSSSMLLYTCGEIWPKTILSFSGLTVKITVPYNSEERSG